MKNLHLLPTDKPSRLFKDQDSIYNLHGIGVNQDIYITSDEEIKLNDYVIQVNFEKTNIQVIRCKTEYQVKIANDKNGSFTKNKIILTTDQDLIADGVQAIDDEFLEWFVKNPSCEYVEVYSLGIEDETGQSCHYKYEIIIPKEEQCTCKEQDPYCCQVHGMCPTCVKKEEPKETLEEAAENYSLELLEAKTIEPHEKTWIKSMFIHIAKEQAERMYSEEDMIKFAKWSNRKEDKSKADLLKIWFEKFKKKKI